eukprot:6212846-Pleurochrysis_carterae.AAC.1
MESQKISETTYGAWLGPESAEILRDKREKATALQQRLGNQTESDRQAEGSRTGNPKRKAGGLCRNSRSGALCDICHTQKVQAQQTMGHYDHGKARILILSDGLSNLRAIERVWREQRNTYRKINNESVLRQLRM